MTEHADWLARTKEEAIDPERPIVDPHHHLWDRSPGWITPSYLLPDILADIEAGHNIVATVFIECGEMYRTEGPEALRPVGETEFVNGVAAMSASGKYGPARVCAGIVGYADLQLGDAVAPVLEAHIAAGGGRFRGIRHNAVHDPSDEVPVTRQRRPPHLYLDGRFREGFAQLARHDLTFEAWCFHPQIPELTDLARAYPDTTIVLNHLGGPLGVGSYARDRAEVFANWRRDIAELATCPNVMAKVGGLNMPINGFGWRDRAKPPTSEEHHAATKDWYSHTIEMFRPERCMFESNFPVDSISCSYVVVWNSFKRLAAGFSEAEKTKLFHDTAMRVYRL